MPRKHGSLFGEDDGLIYRIETWTVDDRPETLIARCSSIAVAQAAVTATIAEYPGKKVTLRQGIRVALRTQANSD